MGELSGNSAQIGLNLNAITSQVKPGQLTYSLNAQISGFEGNAVIYQNEQANEFCFNIPEGFKVIGTHQIIEIETVIYWLVNPTTGASEIGKVVNNSCTYQTIINAPCLNFNIRFPILKAVHKITNCTVEIYWTDALNPRRYIDLTNLPFKQVVQGTNEDSCNVVTTSEIDCNKLNVQPNFAIPLISYVTVASEGSLVAGDYQFAFQYTNSLGDPYTSFYSITNPIPVNDYFKVTPDFNYLTGKSIQVEITDIDTTGLFQYFNLAVIKTINNITSVDLVGTFQIEGSSQKILYTGQSKVNVTLSINDIFEKFPVFDVAGDLTTVQDILVWDDLTTTERITYQSIANKIHLQWVSWKIPPQKNGFKDELNAANHRAYMRDEVYPFDLVVILKNGYQSDRFPIPGRLANAIDLSLVSNEDAQGSDDICETEPQPKPRWQVYNTGTVIDYDPLFKANGSDPCYEGPYQFGEFSYWESTETYPCNEAVWGDLAGKPIRHHKFPDSSVTYHHDSAGSIYPLGVRVDMQAIYNLFKNSPDLTQDQKDRIAAIKIVRGNRANSKSIIAKGLLYNIGVYEKDNSTYFYPNYPFNDLRPDPFILNESNNSIGTSILSQFNDVPTVANTETLLYDNQLPSNTFSNVGDVVTIQYTGRFGSPAFDPKKIIKVSIGGVNMFNISGINANSQNTWTLTLTLTRTGADTLSSTGKLTIQGPTVTTLNDNRGSTASFPFATMLDIRLTGATFNVGPPNVAFSNDGDIVASSVAINYKAASASSSPFLDGFSSPSSRNRFTFHSPDTSFYQPFLGTTLKLESVEFGVTKSHFVQVKNHARYRFPSLNSYLTSLGVGVAIGFLSGTYGISTNVFSGSAAFTAFTVFNDIIFKLLPRKNFAYSFNSLGNYTTPVILPNGTGNKIRRLDIASYLIPGVQGVGDVNTVNNFQREGSVYLRTVDTLPFPSSIPGVPIDNSRFVLSDVGCNFDFQQRNISSYYASIKTNYPDQYGQIYSYEAIDTGFQFLLDLNANFDLTKRFQDVFGGDTFINKFAFKRKLPFFIDNRVNFPDEADIFYDELGNIGFPRFWFSTDVVQGDGGFFNIGSLFGVKVNNFDCKENKFFYNSGKIYLFAYGIVDFFVESGVNVDYRQAFNNREGDYWPHVSGDVPDEWLQENFVTINFDNTYTYNKTYSKQNIENVFTTLPIDFIPGQLCQERFPNKAIYSDRQEDVVFYKKNNWLIYRPVAFYDFPLTYGKLISLEGIENRAVLARFENKSMIYNALLTINTSNPQAAYLGNDTLFKSSPPIDFAETDLGYAGSQNKFFLKTEFGNISTDAKRGNVFLIGGNKAQNIGEFGLAQFFMNNLNFQLKEFFPDYDTDNHFKGVGLHGVYDTKYNRFILTKLDYRPKVVGITYDDTTDTFSLNGETIQLTDTNFFCNVSFTLSYWFETKSWVSFHSYLPNFYVGAIDKFYTGRNDIGSVWRHNTAVSSYNTYYGIISPYVVEYPFNYKAQDEILQSVKDYTKANRITDAQRFVQTDEIFFNKSIVYNDQQCSGVMNLINKPKNNLSAYLQYPIYRTDSRDILFVKSDNFYNYNGFWDIVRSNEDSIWLTSCTSLSEDKVLNVTNLDYNVRSYKKYQMRAKDCKIRHILDNRGDTRLTSQFILTENQVSYK